MNNTILCLLTLHGIGFQQAPQDGQPGYADELHEHLHNYLGPLLCDDPLRERTQAGRSGPIYVQSSWPLGTLYLEAGLRRLGQWNAEHSAILTDRQRSPLSDGPGRIAHIALVHSRLEAQGPQHEAMLAGSVMMLNSLEHYTTVSNLTRTLLSNCGALWQQMVHPYKPEDIPLGQRVRRDAGVQKILGPRGILRQVEEDVAAYICYNSIRERLRCFVREAITRLALRDDVSGIILNAYSNGTVIALDTLNRLPAAAARKLRVLITSGSPLRKYCDLFHWGNYLEMQPTLTRWINVFDPQDPVADPLEPAPNWIRGTAPTDLSGLYRSFNPETGQIMRLPIEDHIVNNLTNSRGGGLQAHNYWDNELEFVRPLAELLHSLLNLNTRIDHSIKQV
jgi:hypothetical protein